MATVEEVAASEKPAKPTEVAGRPRLWPAVALVVMYWIVRAIAATLLTAVAQFGALFWAPVLWFLGFFIWLLGLSRFSWAMRGWISLCVIGGILVGVATAHPSMGLGLILFALPVALTAITLALCVAREGRAVVTLGLPLAASLLSWQYFSLLRLDGVDGHMGAKISWRWEQTAEDRFLQELPTAKSGTLVSAEAPALIATDADWPEFRGPQRDSRRTGVRIAADWKAHPPQEVWRRLIGPGWSSFSVVGDHVFTQDQRGENEAVVCVSLKTGKDYWVHQDKTRFSEVVAGAGPRGTPTFRQGKLYALGGGGKLNCLNAATGEAIWTRDLNVDADAKPPQWGFSSSPLIVEGLAIVFAGGKSKAVVAYDAETGDVKWSGGKGTHSYSSPQLWQAGDTPQVLVVSDYGLEAFTPASGELLWSHEWKLEGMARVVQPHLAGKTLLLGTGYGYGTRQLTITGDTSGWAVQEGWTSRELKPYFNDFVSHNGYAYGFDGDIFCCMNAHSGDKQWKKGRYGHGQVLLLVDQGLLIVISEKGELVLLEANPQKHVELGKLPALKSKTWNHPVVVGDKLLIRNGEEMACYRLVGEGS